MGQLVYTMFTTNNHDSFHLWRKKNLVKHQKVRKYYGHDCRTRCKICSELTMKTSTPVTQPSITSSKLTIETLGQGVKYVQS